MMSILSHLVEMGVDAGLVKLKDTVDKEKLRASLQKYIERHKAYNKTCTLAEEIDFEGLARYITHDMIDAVGTRIFDPDSKKRKQARLDILSAAISQARADTPQAKRRVEKCISNCLNILSSFYQSKKGASEYLLAAKTVDAIDVIIQESNEKTLQLIDKSTEIIAEKVENAKKELLSSNPNFGALFSVDSAISLVQKGEYSSLENGFKKALDHVSVEHPYYPDFGFDLSSGKLVSKALTEKARKLYPPRLVLTGAVRFGNQYFDNPEGNPVDYSYRHQLPITIEVSDAKKYLGDLLDPVQNDVNQLAGKTVIAKPPEFGPAFPCSIKVGNQTFYEYVLMKEQEIMDDGTIIFGNKAQKTALYFELLINPSAINKPSFNIGLNKGNHQELLCFMRFYKALSEVKDLHVYLLEQGKDFYAGYVEDIGCKMDNSSITDVIDILERVCEVEEYFGVAFTLPDAVSNKEYNTLTHVSDFIRNTSLVGTWKEVTFTIILKQGIREGIQSVEQIPYSLSYICNEQIELFSATIEFRFRRTFNCAYIVDIEKLKEITNTLNDGESIQFTIRAGEDNTVIDSLKIADDTENTTDNPMG